MISSKNWREESRKLDKCKCENGDFCGDTQVIFENFITSLLQSVAKDVGGEEQPKRMITDNPKYEYEAGLVNGRNQKAKEVKSKIREWVRG